jgi:TonB family protein
MTWLVETSIRMSLVLAIGLLAALVLRRRSAAVRHWILATAIACAAVVPILSATAPAWTLPAAGPAIAALGPGGDVSVSFSPAPGVKPSPALAQPAIPPVPIVTRIADVAVPIWLVGALINAAILLIGMSRLTRLGSPIAAEDADPWHEALPQVARSLGVTRPVALIRSDRPAVLVTWGLLSPKVLLPADADSWPEERIRVVLAHEMAHVARGDWLVQTGAEALKAIYWFNPLLWLACARLRQESEHACDDVVTGAGVDSQAYATHLLDLARLFGRHRRTWLPAPAMAARPSTLERRIRAMLNVRLNRRPITRSGRWASVLALLVITLPIATFAQDTFATFSGVVVDPQDRLLPATTITVSDAQRNVKHETKTDRNGRFELVGLPAGDYTVEAKLPGFRPLTDSLTVNGQSVDRTLKMQVGLLQETISVVGDGQTVTGSTQSGKAFEKRPVPPCPTGVVSSIGGNIRAPHKVKDVRPGYPGVDGNVELAATIGTDGSVVDVQVVKADRPELGAAAIDAVRQWEFDSTLLNCVPIEVQMNVSVAFRHNQ